ncbi:hypothetical protein [Flavobacterium sp. 3HN19-14]|uniref:hypothetical protein n=1 Tax=Flavobacterium sp. 3HN19-14 TaxID=3448133 RepID=UPI003EE16233
MKSQFLNITAGLFLIGIGALTVSCNKCGSKTTETTTTTVTTTTTDTTDMGNLPPDASTDQASDNSGAGSGNKSTTANASSTKTKGAKDKNGKSLEGYSAPDGTDAENHDGDQYTKNNNTPQPTGTADQIKSNPKFSNPKFRVIIGVWDLFFGIFQPNYTSFPRKGISSFIIKEIISMF